MVENDVEISKDDLNFENDVKIHVPKQLKAYILTEKLHLLNDIELLGKMTDYDSIIEWHGKTIEWKNGKSFGDKLPLEIYWDIDLHFPGCLSQAKADYIIFVKKCDGGKYLYDIYCMNFKKLVEWWWDSGKAKHLAQYQKINKATYDPIKKRRHRSSWYPVIINKIPKEVLFERVTNFDATGLFKLKDGSLSNYL